MMLGLYIPELRKSHPENKDELESVVECCIVSAIVNPSYACS